MGLSRSLVPVAVLATAVLAGCGSGEPGQTQATTQAQSTTETQSTTGEPAAAGPAGAAARSCGGGETGLEDLRVTGVDCSTGQSVAAAWKRRARCASPAAGSRFACSVRGYRCLGAATERGVAVSCARPDRSIAFVARRD